MLSLALAGTRSRLLLSALGLLLVASVAAPAHAKWIMAESENFIVFSNAGKGRTKDFLTELEGYRHHVAAFTQVGTIYEALKCKIYLVKSDKLYEELTGSEETAGIFTQTATGPVAIVNASDRDFSKQVLLHEYVHHIQYLGQPTKYPLWYQEGLAEFLSASRLKKKHFEFGDVLVGRYYALASQKRWHSINTLLETNTLSGAMRAPRAMELFYAQSWLLTHMLFMEADLRAGGTRFVAELQKGVPPKKALQDTLGMTYQDLADRLNAYFASKNFKKFTMPRDPLFETQVSIRKLGEKAERLVELQARFDFGGQRTANTDLLSLLDQTIAEEGTSLGLDLLKAQILARMGDYGPAIKVARDLRKRLPGRRTTTDLLAKLLIDGALYDSRQPGGPPIDYDAIGEAIALQYETGDILGSFDTEIYLRLVHALKIHPDYMGTDIVPFVERALQLYPQSRSARRQYGFLLHRQGRYDEACNMLQPLYATAQSREEADGLTLVLFDQAYSGGRCPLF